MSKLAWTALVTTGMALTAWAGDSTYTTTDKSTKHTTRIYVTNYVQVPVRCGQLESADVVFQPGHTYRLMVAGQDNRWRNWGVVRAGTNSQGRIWFPLASTKTISWQLVDVTPGFTQAALPKLAPDCTTKREWVVLGLGNIRPVSQ